MPDVSIIELAVYGTVEIAAIIILMITAIRDTPESRANSLARFFFIMPGLIAAGVMAGTGLNITMDQPALILTNVTTYNETGDLIFTELGNQTLGAPHIITLQNPGWTVFHVGMFLLIVVFLVRQILILLTKTE